MVTIQSVEVPHDVSFCAYLAGPEVFLLPPDQARDIGEQKKKCCRDHGIDARFPLDETPADHDDDQGHATFAVCIKLMGESNLLIANMTPFRGVSMDVGTAIEIGYMYGRGHTVFGYTNSMTDYAQRVPDTTIDNPDRIVDADGLHVENFGYADNLMCEGTVWERTRHSIIRPDQPVPTDQMLTDLATFEKCVRTAARVLAIT